MGESLIAEEILRHYERADEDGRLRSGAERLELARMQDILRRFLPEPPAAVLDVGGASGIHAQWLAADGHRVHVVDPVAGHVRKAAGISGVTASVGAASALAVPDGSCDAVLLLGPLYHLVDRADRLVALREAARAVRPGGLVAAATINRFTSLHDGLRRGFLARPGVPDVVGSTLRDGKHQPGDVELFTTAFLHHPDEPAEEVAEAGLTCTGSYAVEGTAWLIDGIESWLDSPERRRLLLWGLREVEREPSLLGASRHLLTLATKEHG